MSHSYDIIIGLEVHVQIACKTKIFCGCPTTFGAAPNTQVCPVCAGLPGTLPVLNRKVFEQGIRAVLALGGKVAVRAKFDRKNYFYPDLPKGYQISQYDQPIGTGGGIKIITETGERTINLTRLHLEEDAGKLIHDESRKRSLVDLNRAGVPLAEIVSEPEIKSPDEAYVYLTNLKAILKTVGISDADMEKGQLRCDANVSLRKSVHDPFGTKVEIKNVNSFKNVRAALIHEIERQAKMLDNGEAIAQETRLFDAATGRTSSMRSKEQAHDYRYFPEPDLVPFEIDSKQVDAILKSLPELPEAKLGRLRDQYSLNAYDASLLVQDEALVKLFERLSKQYSNFKSLVNWLLGSVAAHVNDKSLDYETLDLPEKEFIALLQMVDDKKVSLKAAREEVFPELLATRKSPADIVAAKGLAQISDAGAIDGILTEVINANPSVVNDFKSGKTNALMFLVGQVMRKSQGKANPNLVKEMLEKKLSA